MLMAASIIPLAFDPWDAVHQKRAHAACMTFPWLLCIGFTLTFSALFTKTYRIKQIMRSATRFKRIKLTARDVMKPMIALLFLNIIVLTVWTAIYPLQHRMIDLKKDRFGRTEEMYAICSTDGSRSHIIFISILGFINLGSVFFALIQAYQTRKISTELSESAYIFRVMSIILYAAFLGIPVLILAGENVDAYFFVWAGLIFIVCSSILLLIFLPKILATKKGTTETTLPPRWQIMADAVNPKQKEEENTEHEEGIQVYRTPEEGKLEEENIILKNLCLNLSRSQGLDYDSLLRDTIYHSTREDMEQLL